MVVLFEKRAVASFDTTGNASLGPDITCANHSYMTSVKNNLSIV